MTAGGDAAGGGRGEGARLVVSVFVLFALFHGLALALGSDRGQAGLLVGLAVVAATLLADRLLFRASFAASARAVGLGAPAPRGLAAAGALSFLLLLVIPLFARSRGSALGLHPGWIALLPGLFAQAGIAEEVLFRGYLFGRLRRGRSFWRAALLATLPFFAVHLLLFATMPWSVALAATLLAVILSFPLAHLFELGGDTVWAPALLHFCVQGAIKLAVLTPDPGAALPLVWMAASAVLPFLTFLVPRPSGATQDGAIGRRTDGP